MTPSLPPLLIPPNIIGEERREAEAERERAARDAELVVERMEARVVAVQDDVKQRQLQVLV